MSIGIVSNINSIKIFNHIIERNNKNKFYLQQYMIRHNKHIIKLKDYHPILKRKIN